MTEIENNSDGSSIVRLWQSPRLRQVYSDYEDENKETDKYSDHNGTWTKAVYN